MKKVTKVKGSLVYRLSGCELDAARFELRRAGQAVPVEPQVLELLLYLVAHRERAVTRDELFENLWRGRVVTDSALNSRIKAVRAAIGDNGASQAQIRTLHRTGYRFVGAVEELAAGPAAAAIPALETLAAESSAARGVARSSVVARRATAPLARRPLVWLAGAAALGSLVTVGMLSQLPRAVRDLGESVAFASSVIPVPGSESAHKALAVLPFTDLSADAEQEYFADGIRVELTKVLSHVPDLRITGTVSIAHFKGRTDPPRVIGEKLGVEHLLTGSVRKAGERVRINVELLDAASGYQLWAESYERQFRDVLDVQDEIAERVASALQVKLGLGASAELGMTRNVAAYDAFLRGYAAYNERRPESFALAVEHMHRALALDPAFSRAWAYLYCIYLDGGSLMPERAAEWLHKAQEALEHARSLTPDSPFVRILNAREDMRYGRTLEARATLAAMPAGYWTADRFVTRDVFLGRSAIMTGHMIQAVEALERARAADPLSPVVALYLSLAYSAAGDAEQALATSDRGLALGELVPVISGNAILIALGTGDADEIRRRVEAAPAPGIPGRQPINAQLLPLLDDPAAARAALRRLAAVSAAPDFVRSVQIAHWAAYFGDLDLALGELSAIAHGSVDEGLLWRPVLSDVRRLPGFKDLVRREGLVDYWRVAGWPDFCRPTTETDFECS